MKKSAIIILTAFVTSWSFGQDLPNPRKGATKEERLVKLQEQLNLSTEQVNALKAVEEDLGPELKELRENKSMSKPDKMRAHADILERRKTKTEAILTDEQLAEWEVLREQMKDKRKSRRGKRP
ncbi:MAG: hypothetical protein AAF789_12795 [Bacteroidota bacterium]